MPFVPRSQIEQQQANAAPPPMPVVENYPKQPTASSPSCPQQTSNTEEQINELNELLVHVLDEISSMKDALYENARKKNKRHKQQRKKHMLSDDEDTSEDDQEEPPAASPPPKKTPLPPTRPKVLAFSSCF